MKEEQTAVIFARHKIFVYCFVVEMLLFLVINKEAAILLKFAAETIMMSHAHFLFCTAGEKLSMVSISLPMKKRFLWVCALLWSRESNDVCNAMHEQLCLCRI